MEPTAINRYIVLFLITIIFLLIIISLTNLLERKLLSSIQRRRGPNITGIFGLLQPIADGLKLLLKEVILPSSSNIVIFILAPIFTFFCSMVLWIVIPFDYFLSLIDSQYSGLFLLAVSSLGVYGIIFSGWSSNSKYAFLGGLRSAAQMISYEITISFTVIIMVIMTNSFNIIDFVNSQEYIWFIFPLFPLYFIFIISTLAETNRAPFDLPEAEAELVAGYNIEYSSIVFALFFLGEYSNILLMSTLSSIFFLGGWLAPFNLTCMPPYFWLSLKISLNVFIFIWVRASFPRYRYDQLMKLGWKILLPISLVLLLFFSLMLLFIHIY
jgi:NADH-quinone oxidoreductase subunit H